MQSTLPLNDERIQENLSKTQYLIKRKLDESIVLLGGFSDFPDNRNAFEWSKHHPKVNLYPVTEGWNEKILPSQDKIESIVRQVEALKLATIIQLRNQEEDQEKNTLYYMTVAELPKISPVLASLSQLLIEAFSLEPLCLKGNQPEAVQESECKIIKEEAQILVVSSEEEAEEKMELETHHLGSKQNMVFSPKQGMKFSDVVKHRDLPPSASVQEHAVLAENSKVRQRKGSKY